MNWKKVLGILPEVRPAIEKRLPFNKKLKWTGIVLVLFFILSYIPLYGLSRNALDQFEYLSIILGARFGFLLSLGIGPIVTAGIILQLLVGSGLLNLDLTTHEGKLKFQGLQKIMTLFFIIFEAAIYVLMGGLAPAAELIGTSAYTLLQMGLIAQLSIGGYLIVLMDEVVSKYGFGSGVSLFIAAGVSNQIFIAAFNPIKQGAQYSVGKALQLFQALAASDPITALSAVAAIVATIVVFLVAVYGQAMKVEIPLSFGRVRGYGIRWPLNFMYTSNIPVILIAALLANVQLFASLLQNWGWPILGTYENGIPVSGLVQWVNSPNILDAVLKGGANVTIATQAVVYTTIMIVGSMIFSYVWMKTSNMDAAAQSKQILASGLQIPGFRRDPRVFESILNRYIPGLTIMGGAFVGFLAALADLSGALSRGTGILLTVMIVYKLYEEIARQHAYDMHPALRKVLAPD